LRAAVHPSGICCDDGHGDAPALNEAAPPANVKSAHAITRLAEQGDLTGELLAAAMRQKKLGKKRRPLYDAAVSGTALRLRGQYITRRSAAGKESRRAVTQACERSVAHLRRAAENVLELGCAVEHYLDVAFDTKPIKLAFPPLPHLSGPLMLEKVPGWVPPDKRVTSDPDFDPAEHVPVALTPEELDRIRQNPDPLYDDVPGEDLDAFWERREAYRRERGNDSDDGEG
jgi:hypothetical protein